MGNLLQHVFIISFLVIICQDKTYQNKIEINPT